MLLLLPVVLAVLLGIGPALREEFNPIRGDCFLVDCRNRVWGWDATGRRTFKTDIALSAEQAFRARFSCREVVFTKPAAGPVLGKLDEVLVEIGEFAPKQHLVGHNYTVSLALQVHDGLIGMGNDQEGWCECEVLPAVDGSPHWRLVDVSGFDYSRVMGMDMAVGAWQVVFAPVDANEAPREDCRTFVIEMEILSSESSGYVSPRH